MTNVPPEDTQELTEDYVIGILEVIKSLVGKNYDVFLTICDKNEKGGKVGMWHADTGGPERAAMVLRSVVEILTKNSKDSSDIPSSSHIVIPETNSIH